MGKEILVMGKRIQQRRKNMKITQGQLAERLEISSNHLSAIENGKENPSLEVFAALCEELRVTPDYLMLGALHANNIPQNIGDSLRLCSEKDIQLISMIVECLVERNAKQWNDDNYV